MEDYVMGHRVALTDYKVIDCKYFEKILCAPSCPLQKECFPDLENKDEKDTVKLHYAWWD